MYEKDDFYIPDTREYLEGLMDFYESMIYDVAPAPEPDEDQTKKIESSD